MPKPAPLFALLLTAAVAVGASVNYGAAIEKQRARVAAEPGNAGAQNDLGNLLVLIGDLEEAEVAYRRAIALDPARPSTHFNLGLLLQERGDHATALLQYRKTIDLQPDHAWAHYQTGVIYARWHLKPLALRAYSRALALDPRLGDSRFNPHLIENPLATEAMLRSYRRHLPEAQAPAIFDDAPGVARMLIFESSPRPDAAAASPATPATPSPKPAAAPPTGTLRGSGSTLPTVEANEKPEPPVDESVEAAEGGYLEVKVLDSSDLPSGGVPALGVAGPGAPAAAPTSRRPGSRQLPTTPVPVPTGDPTPFAPGTSRPGPGFDPSPTSTGRMAIEVVPLPG